MKRIEKSMWVPYSDHQMFLLVQDVPRYGEFLPGCESASIIQHLDEHTMLARMDVNVKGVRLHLVTRNQATPSAKVEMRLHEGPFRHLAGYWQFQAIDASACQVTLFLEYNFSNRIIEGLLSGVFGKLAENLVDAFYQRARSIYPRA